MIEINREMLDKYFKDMFGRYPPTDAEIASLQQNLTIAEAEFHAHKKAFQYGAYLRDAYNAALYGFTAVRDGERNQEKENAIQTPQEASHPNTAG